MIRSWVLDDVQKIKFLKFHGCTWPFMATLRKKFVKFVQIWPYMAIYDHLWIIPVKNKFHENFEKNFHENFDSIHGHKWPFMAIERSFFKKKFMKFSIPCMTTHGHNRPYIASVFKFSWFENWLWMLFINKTTTQYGHTGGALGLGPWNFVPAVHTAAHSTAHGP